jgi:site-specific recombinase XerD
MLEPISPQVAVEQYLKGRTDLGQSSRANYEYRLRKFVQWCQQNDVDNLNDLTGRKLHEYKVWRSQGLSNVSLKKQLGTVRMFLRFCENIDAVPSGISEKLELPDLGFGEDVDDTMLSPKEAETVLEYLQRFEYATMRHAIFHTLWHTGIRMSTLRAFDVTDFYPNEGYLRAVHRPDSGTPLKNRERGEREININSKLVSILTDWVEKQHPRIEDEYGRMPLIGTNQGRAHGTTIRTNIYKLTRPCEYTNECPHGEKPADCEATKPDGASKCPSSVSPHAIRKGSITYHRNKGWPTEAISDRADVSSEVLEKHYDKGTVSEKRKRREKFLDRL